MIKKIISGGQTGADQAALDAAIKWNIPYGGWIAKGRLTETGRLADIYKMQEMPTDSNAARTEQNVIDSDGTLIISHGPLTGGSKYTHEMALKHDRPHIHINLNDTRAFDAARQIYSWIIKAEIRTLNVAGPRASNDPYIYQSTMHILTTVLIMDFIETAMVGTQKTLPSEAITLTMAADNLISKMSLRERCFIANMPESEFIYLDLAIGNYIRKNFGLKSGHEALIKTCRNIMEKDDISDDEISQIIIKELWKKLHKTHVLRIIN